MEENKIETLLYNTRDAKGNDIVKNVIIKEYPIVSADFTCKICDKQHTGGTPIKKIVSANFTDWAYVGDYVCSTCSRYFSLHFYNYILEGDTIHLYNVREMAEELKKLQKSPFKAVITKSQKKHLFYKAVFNDNPDQFVINLEEEQITVNREELCKLFLFVESLMVLGERKESLAAREISYPTLKKLGLRLYRFLNAELKERQIMIPLFLAQKPNITEEEALCNLDLILMS